MSSPQFCLFWVFFFLRVIVVACLSFSSLWFPKRASERLCCHTRTQTHRHCFHDGWACAKIAVACCTQHRHRPHARESGPQRRASVVPQLGACAARGVHPRASPHHPRQPLCSAQFVPPLSFSLVCFCCRLTCVCVCVCVCVLQPHRPASRFSRSSRSKPHAHSTPKFTLMYMTDTVPQRQGVHRVCGF